MSSKDRLELREGETLWKGLMKGGEGPRITRLLWELTNRADRGRRGS